MFCYFKFWGVCAQSLSPVQLFAAPWNTVQKAPLSMVSFRQEYWSWLPFPPLGDLPNPGIEHTSPKSLVLQADSLPPAPPEKPSNWGEKRAKKAQYSELCLLSLDL